MERNNQNTNNVTILSDVAKMEEVISQAKRFGCSYISFYMEDELEKIGKDIAQRITDNDYVFTIETSGTSFFTNYVRPYCESKVKNKVGYIDVKNDNVSLPVPYLERDKNIVIIDDVISTGSTLRKALNLLSEYTTLINRDITIYSIISMIDVVDTGLFDCKVHFYDKGNLDTYVVFPWEM